MIKIKKRISILLVEDHMIVREGFRKMLELDPDIQVIGEAQDGRQGVTMAKLLKPDVILMDIAMPLLNGLEATRQIIKLLPKTKVLILSAHTDDDYTHNALLSGASGFLLKQSSAIDVCSAIREVMLGKKIFSDFISNRMEYINPSSPVPNSVLKKTVMALTAREMEVLQLIAEGMANKQTAAELKISIKTVEKHREHLMEKLDIHDTAGLTRYAIGAGIIESRVQITIL